MKSSTLKIVMLSVSLGVVLLIVAVVAVVFYGKQRIFKKALGFIVGENNKSPYKPSMSEPDMFTHSKEFAVWLESEFTKNVNVTVQQLTPLIEMTYSSSSKPVIGMVYVNKKYTNVLVVVFRGTQTKKEIVQDLTYSQTKIDQDYLFHKGFWEIFTQMEGFTQLKSRLLQIQDPRLTVCGHSLGCGLAVLTAWTLVQNKVIKPSGLLVYLFASPRLGNEAFAKAYDLLIGSQTFRYTNSCDLVPQIPLAAMINLATPSKPWIYNHVGNPVYFTDNQKSLYLNHAMSTYRHFIFSSHDKQTPS